MLGVRIAKRKNEPQKPANPCGTKLRARIFFGAGKFASQTYPAGGIKKQGETGDAPPAAEEANPFRGSGAICGV